MTHCIKKDFRLINVNFRSLRNKVVDLETILLSYKPHITVITETWLSKHIADSELVPSGYSIYRCDRNEHGGGVAVVVPNNLCVRIFENSPRETIWCKVVYNGWSLFVGAIYRPPASPVDFMHSIEEFMKANIYPTANIILSGDFNLPHIDWSKYSIGSVDVLSSDALLSIALAYDLRQIVQDYTRIQGNSCSCLDLVLASLRLNRFSCVTLPGVSDHKMVFATFDSCVQQSKRSPQYKIVRDYSNSDDVGILDYLESSLYGFCDNSSRSDVNTLWCTFKSIVTHCVDTYVPTRRKMIRKSNPWVTREIIHLKRKLKRIRKTLGAASFQFQRLKSVLNEQLQCSKYHYYSVVLPNFIRTAPRKFWRHIAPAKADVECIKVNGKRLYEDNDKANAFNAFFQSVFTRAQKDSSLVFHIGGNDTPCIQFTKEGLAALLLNLDDRKATGPDELPCAF